MLRTKILAAFAAAALIAPAASATAYTFDFTKADYSGQSGEVAGAWYVDKTASVGVHVTAWQLYDSSDSGTAYDDVRSANVGIWTGYGLGVEGPGESTGGNQHQIDNSNGAVDFIVLQFSQAVSLTSFGRNVYTLAGVNGSPDSDASFIADSANNYVKTTNWMSTYNLTTANVGTTGIAESAWTQISGSGSNNLASTPDPKVTSSVWLIGAAVLPSGDRDDGFKLSSLSVTAVPASVPEPATWAMMLVGFGAIGSTLRSRRGRLTMNAAIGG